jgi:hypothetical protein
MVVRPHAPCGGVIDGVEATKGRELKAISGWFWRDFDTGSGSRVATLPMTVKNATIQQD